MTRLEEIEEKMDEYGAVDHSVAANLIRMVKAMRELISTNCPCCNQDDECLDGCTFEEDCPSDYDEISYNRSKLKRIGVL